MKSRRWLGAVAHALLGLLFPFAAIGSIILIYGFMTPPTFEQRLKGIAIAAVYLGAIVILNWLTLRGLPRREKMKSILLHVLTFAAAGIIMMILLRW